MRSRRRKVDDTADAITNFALTFAKAVLVTCFALFLMISPEQKKDDGVKPKMEFMITMEWATELNYDVDIWMRDPDGKMLYYSNKEVGFLNLERDDLGWKNNTVVVDGKKVVVPNNQEIVAIRGIRPGEYVVNAHLYAVRSGQASGNGNRDSSGGDTGYHPVPPFDVKLRIDKLNPRVKKVFEGSSTISNNREEVHLIRFTVTPEGEVVNLTKELPVKLREPTTMDPR
jgi:hypothetical protein